ncbi:MAG: YggT family protein [Pseudohongiella sp.]|nr:YggT family protein [Pseudohongiella sp.]MDP2129089.1 YggT family protein [Pseudohongiella sp.]
MNALGNIGSLLVSTLGTLYMLAILLRFLLQLSRADFYNPITQMIVRFTDPGVLVLRRFIPGYRGIDFATLVFAFLVECALICALIMLAGIALPGVGLIIAWAFAGILNFTLDIYFWSLLISIVASFIAPFSDHPALVLLRQLTEPVMAPFRRLLPSMGGLDLSPIFLFLSIQIIKIMLVAPIGANPAFVPGM